MLIIAAVTIILLSIFLAVLSLLREKKKLGKKVKTGEHDLGKDEKEERLAVYDSSSGSS